MDGQWSIGANKLVTKMIKNIKVIIKKGTLEMDFGDLVLNLLLTDCLFMLGT